MIGVNQLVDRSLEVAGQGAADAARIQFRHGNARVLHESAVNSDLTVFVLQQDDLFFLQAACQQLLNQRCLTGAKEAGDNIYFYHL